MSRPAARAVLVAVVLAVLGGLLGFVVAGRGPLPFESVLLDAVTALPVPGSAWSSVTAAGDRLFLLPVSLTVLLVLATAGRPRVALLTGVMLLAMSLTVDPLKELVARPRPEGWSPDLASGFAYPSGHALQGAAVYGIVALVALRARLPPRAGGTIACLAVLLVVLVGLSRVALGVHHPTDVLGGWLLGTAMVAVFAAASLRVDSASG